MSGGKNRSINNARTQLCGERGSKASRVSWQLYGTCAFALILALFTLPAGAQNFMVQCPNSTLWHPAAATSVQGEPAYTGPQLYQPPTALTNGVPLTYVNNGGTVKCQQISGGDGYMTEADGNQTFMFSFGPLSGLDKIKNGQAGTDYTDEFDQPYCDPSGAITTYNNGQPIPYAPGQPNPLAPNTNLSTCGLNGAVGYLPPAGYRPAAGQAILVGNGLTSATPTGVLAVIVSDIANFPNATPGAGYASPPLVTFGPPDCTPISATCVHVQATGIATLGNGSVIEVGISNPGNGYLNAPSVTFTPTSPPSQVSGTDPAAIMNTGVMNGNIPAPEIAFDEDDEFFLTLTNVGMIMRPDLFEQHTVHFHGYPNASSFYDGVPDASLAINIGASFTYYYLAPDAGTYFWHCHITPPEHLQMGMVGQLYVRPRQNRVPVGTNLYYAMTGSGTQLSHGAFGTATGLSQQSDLRTACNSNGESELYNGSTTSSADILCSIPSPAANTGVAHAAGYKYVYNDGDGSTRYEVDVPIQMHGFDPNFHFVGMTFNPEGFADMKDKYFLLNGRSYPDTVAVATSSVNPAVGWTGGLPDGTANPDVGAAGGYGTNSITTQGSDGQSRPEQPISTLVTLSQSGAPDGGPQIAALRIVNLSVSEYHTLGSLSIPLHVIGWNAKMLRDQAGNNMDYYTNSITIGGGESMDALLDACAVRGPASTNYKCTTPVPVGTYFLYTPNLDHLSNDAENFGGLMTEVVVTP
jgi:Multicopper oxidase